MSQKTVWQLKSSHDRRVKGGHPWVYSNEIQALAPISETGPVELRAASGQFVAWGVGNAHSLISFRVVSRNPDELDVLSPAFFLRRWQGLKALRERLGFGSFSYRLCFGEADGLPGLVADSYVLETGQRVLVLQAHSSGMDRCLPQAIEGLKELYGKSLGAVVLRKDMGVRAQEGLAVANKAEVVWVNGSKDPSTLSQARIRIRGAWAGKPEDALLFHVDLLEGQKTGFFLDQWANIREALSLLETTARTQKRLRVLDLCCYAGQWGAQVARFASHLGIKAAITGVDASAPALALAEKNVIAAGGTFEGREADVLRGFGEGEFDLVVCDPPAFVKTKKDLGPGRHAYLTLNEKAMSRVASQGLYVSCSCSAHVQEADFAETLAKAVRRAHAPIQWVSRGRLSPDHPIMPEFPEGQYLKSWFGFCAERKI